jgi:pimeloyl-ACP methyl ester carboxylesterase
MIGPGPPSDSIQHINFHDTKHMIMRSAGPLRFLLLVGVLASLCHAAADGSTSTTKKASTRRRLMSDEELFGCNTIVDTIPADEIQGFLSDAIDISIGNASFAAFFLKSLVKSQSNFGVQVRKVCASCADFAIDNADYLRYCGEDVYGYNSTFSGLVLFPLDENGTLPAGTLVGSLINHPSTVVNVPTATYNGTTSDAQLLVFGLIPASWGIPVVLPDFFGYGVSNSKISKGFIIRQSYETSIVPLWYKTAQILQNETNCRTALADELHIGGYSEGGYATMVVAQALYNLNWTILRADAGAFPTKLASLAIPIMIKNADLGEIPLEDFGFIFLLFGSAYSSTYRDIASFDQGQDMLNASDRGLVVQVVNEATTFQSFQAVVGNDVIGLYDEQLLAWSRAVYASDDLNACSQDFVEVGLNDMLCAGLKENDLTDLLETVQFPTYLCHGTNDTIVAFENLPNISKNENLTLQVEPGSHPETALACTTSIIQYLASSEFLTYPVKKKNTATGCPADSSQQPPSQPVAPVPSMPSSPSVPNMNPTSPEPTPTPSGARQLSTGVIAVLFSSYLLFK